MILRRVCPAFVLVLFGLPMFIGLGYADLFGDEAGHSFSVDRILETGDWLIPKSSPFPDEPFLEKPPLKFWLVAAGIKAGLPHDEFGLRFWDPLFGSLAFLYVLGIGRRVGGYVCGALAAMILFVHGPLLAAHGLRGNNMEAALLLAYCGGMFHYLRWAESDDSARQRWLHAVAVGAYFTLGFMVKFVAAAFLPVVLGLASLLSGGYRTRFLRDWRIWLGASVVSLALIAPWFVYCTARFGWRFWDVIFGAHVYTRLTSYLDPAHVQPWSFYFTELRDQLRSSNSLWLVLLGAALLLVDAIRLRRPVGLLVLLWFAIPLAIMSLGTSKLYHYAYPFLPPVALAGGYVGTFLWSIVRPALDRAIQAAGRLPTWSARPGLSGLRHPATRALFLGIASLSLVVVVWTLANGRVIVRYGDVTLLRNSSLLRPALVAVAMTLLGGWPQAIGQFGIPVLLFAIAPTDAYGSTIQSLSVGRHVVRPTRDCVLAVGARPELTTNGPRGMYVDGKGSSYGYDGPFNHEYAYYFRKVRPWMRPPDVPESLLYRYLFDPAEQRPMLMTDSRYHAVLDGWRAVAGVPSGASTSIVAFEDDLIMVLPGPYGSCGPGARLRTAP